MSRSDVTHHALADDDAEAVWFIGCLAKIRADGARTGGALGIVEFIHPPGFATPPHVHHEEDEAFYVIEGTMSGFCGGAKWTAGPGGFVWLPRGIPHGYAVVGEATLRSLAITLPAGFERFVAEAGEPAKEPVLPTPGPLDIPKLVAAATKYGQDTLGPPGALPEGVVAT